MPTLAWAQLGSKCIRSGDDCTTDKGHPLIKEHWMWMERCWFRVAVRLGGPSFRYGVILDSRRHMLFSQIKSLCHMVEKVALESQSMKWGNLSFWPTRQLNARWTQTCPDPHLLKCTSWQTDPFVSHIDPWQSGAILLPKLLLYVVIGVFDAPKALSLYPTTHIMDSIIQIHLINCQQCKSTLISTRSALPFL